MTIGHIRILQNNHIHTDMQKFFATVAFDYLIIILFSDRRRGVSPAPAVTWEVDRERVSSTDEGGKCHESSN